MLWSYAFCTCLSWLNSIAYPPNFSWFQLSGASPDLVNRLIPDHIKRQMGLHLFASHGDMTWSICLVKYTSLWSIYEGIQVTPLPEQRSPAWQRQYILVEKDNVMGLQCILVLYFVLSFLFHSSKSSHLSSQLVKRKYVFVHVC